MPIFTNVDTGYQMLSLKPRITSFTTPYQNPEFTCQKSIGNQTIKRGVEEATRFIGNLRVKESRMFNPETCGHSLSGMIPKQVCRVDIKSDNF